jgi:hypothetical protein
MEGGAGERRPFCTPHSSSSGRYSPSGFQSPHLLVALVSPPPHHRLRRHSITREDGGRRLEGVEEEGRGEEEEDDGFRDSPTSPFAEKLGKTDEVERVRR